MSAPLFYVGLHMPNHAASFPRACVSINRLRTRRLALRCPDVLIDSGAFTELSTFGHYRHSPGEYAGEVLRLHNEGIVKISAAVSQDFMCEPFMLARTGLTLDDHQRLTIERYDALAAMALPFPIMPVLQGYTPAEYVAHVESYGARLRPGMWVGVGSVCKRNGSPESVLGVLAAIDRVRPDLRLHGFGVKSTSLTHPGVRSLLYSADSMAWSFSARRQGRNGNSVVEATAFSERIAAIATAAIDWWQPPLLMTGAAA